MQPSRGLIGMALALTVACLLCSCRSGERTGNGTEDAGKGHLEWGPVEPIAGVWVNSPVTVMSPKGTATVVWVGEHGAVMREAPPGKPWKPVEAVAHASLASHVIAGVDKDGALTVAWATHADGNGRYAMRSAHRRADGSWSDPVELGGGPEGDTGWQGWDLAVSPSGAAVFAWSDEDGRLHAFYRTTDGEWSAPTSLPGASWPASPMVTIGPDGLATVAYGRDNPRLLTLVQGSAAGWEEPLKLETPVEERPYDIDAAGAGETVVVWQESDHRFVTGRVRDKKMTDERPLTEKGEQSVEITVDASPDGSARFVWRLQDETPGYEDAVPTAEPAKDVYSIHQSATGKLSELEVIGPAGPCAPEATMPVALNRNDRGDTIIAWSGADSSGLDVAYRIHGAEDWAKQDDAVPDGSGPTCFDSPAAALAADGSAVLTWGNFQSNAAHFRATELLTRRATISE